MNSTVLIPTNIASKSTSSSFALFLRSRYTSLINSIAFMSIIAVSIFRLSLQALWQARLASDIPACLLLQYILRLCVCRVATLPISFLHLSVAISFLKRTIALYRFQGS